MQFALTVPTIYDRVCQQALLNRLEPIFEPIFDDASFGYRRGRSTKDALRKVWKEIQGGSEWIVDGDLRDFFGSVDHEKITFQIPPGQYQFIFGYGGGVHEEMSLASNAISFDLSESGFATLPN